MPESMKRKASEPAGAELKKSRMEGRTSTLVPVGERKTVKKGTAAPELLRLLCEDTSTGEKKELHFKALVHADIDWDSKEHVDKINAWRNQIYGRAGIKHKSIIVWTKDEEAYVELYWQLLVAEANKHGILMPKPKYIRAAFNTFFVGKVLPSAAGGVHPAREERGGGPFASKMSRLTRHLKHHLERKLYGHPGVAFYPEITQEMITNYIKLKKDLVEMGCKDCMIIPWTDVEDAANVTAPVLRCRKWLAGLPDAKKGKKKVEPEDETLVGLSELDKELLELATPVAVEDVAPKKSLATTRREVAPVTPEEDVNDDSQITLVGDEDIVVKTGETDADDVDDVDVDIDDADVEAAETLMSFSFYGS